MLLLISSKVAKNDGADEDILMVGMLIRTSSKVAKNDGADEDILVVGCVQS